MNAYSISPAGMSLVQDHEGFHAEPVQLPDGSWLVGFNHVRAEAGEQLSEAEAVQLLSIDLAPIEAMVNEKITCALSQSQFDALVSFAFSVGEAAFLQSQVLRRVNAGDFLAAACAMDAWRKSDVTGELDVIDALVRRRAAEKAMFLRDLACAAAPSSFVRVKLDHAASILGAPSKFASAPAVGSIPVAQPQMETATQLVDILISEPATKELLLTEVVVNDAEGEDEIVTAHAKPVARKLDEAGQSANTRAPLSLPVLRLPTPTRSFETFGLAALLLFGLALIGGGVSMLLEGHADGISLLGASSLCAPGVAAVLLATYGFLHAPRAKARAA